MSSFPLKQHCCTWAFIPLILLLTGCAGVDITDTESPSTAETTVPAAEPQSNPSAVAMTAFAAPGAMSEPTVSRRRAQPAVQFPEIDFDTLPAVSEPEPVIEPVIEPEVDADLWQRLRAGFRLSNLEAQPHRVEHFEKWYASHPKYFARLAERAYWFLPYVLDQVEARNMPTEIALLPAVESAFRPDATSRSKAAGMWQFIGSTGRRFGLRQDWWMDGRRDLVQSTRAALDYLEYLSQEFDGDWEHALAAYNAGEGTIGRQIKKNRLNNKPIHYTHLKLRKETSEYVPRLFAIRNILKDPAKYNIELEPLENKPTLAVIDLKTQTDISVAASFLSLNRKQLHFLNLGYKRGVTPPNGPHVLVVPADEATILQAKLIHLSPAERMQWAHHKVKKGEYLGKIARIHGVSVKSIMRANSLQSKLIHSGQELRIPLNTGAFRYAGPAIKSDNSEPQKHLVAAGDSLWKISRRYSVSLNNLLRWNQLSSRTTLHPGQSILVTPE